MSRLSLLALATGLGLTLADVGVTYAGGFGFSDLPGFHDLDLGDHHFPGKDKHHDDDDRDDDHDDDKDDDDRDDDDGDDDDDDGDDDDGPPPGPGPGPNPDDGLGFIECEELGYLSLVKVSQADIEAVSEPHKVDVVPSCVDWSDINVGTLRDEIEENDTIRAVLAVKGYVSTDVVAVTADSTGWIVLYVSDRDGQATGTSLVQ